MYSILTALCYYSYLSSLATATQPAVEIPYQYDMTSFNESQIISVSDPNSLSGNAQNSGENVNGSETFNRTTCRSCAVREKRKRQWIEKLKNKIEHALKLDVLGMPNVTNRIIPRVPSYQKLQERYSIASNLEMQADSPYSLIEDEEEEYGRPQRTYTYAQEPPSELGIEAPNAVYFNIPDFGHKDIYKALMWVYIDPLMNINVRNNVTEMFLYGLVPPGKNGGPPVKSFLKKRKRYRNDTPGWHHFDVKDIVRRWKNRPSRNLGLVVEAFDIDDNNLITSPTSPGNLLGYGPSLDVRTRTPRHRRRKRSTPLVCDDNNHIEACCRYPLIVNFVEFGWDFVIAPHWYAAFYCAGNCEDEYLDAQTHTHIMQQVDATVVNAPKAGPCCSPTRLSNLEMLYFDHQQSIQHTTLPKMKVERCGCA